MTCTLELFHTYIQSEFEEMSEQSRLRREEVMQGNGRIVAYSDEAKNISNMEVARLRDFVIAPGSGRESERGQLKTRRCKRITRDVNILRYSVSSKYFYSLPITNYSGVRCKRLKIRSKFVPCKQLLYESGSSFVNPDFSHRFLPPAFHPLPNISGTRPLFQFGYVVRITGK